MSMTRRALLKATAGGVAGFAYGPVLTSLLGCTPSTPGAPANLILGGGRYTDLDTNRIEHVLSIVDLDAKDVSLISLGFLAHGIHIHADEPNLLAIFEKKGPHAVEFDLAARRVTRSIETSKARAFYGHGAYSVDGEHLFATETVLESLDGIIAVRDARTHANLGEFPSYGKEPHECKLIDSGRTLVVTNGGGSGSEDAPCVTYIDVASQNLIERIAMTNTRINTGHSALGSDGALVVVSAPRRGLATTEPGAVSIRPRGAALETIANPVSVTGRMQGEALSVIVQEEAEIAAVTHPDGGMVTFWSTADRRLLKVIDLPHPRGVTLTHDDEFFVLSYGADASLMRVEVESLELIDDSLVPNTLISGSHIYNWSRGLTEILAPGRMQAAGSVGA